MPLYHKKSSGKKTAYGKGKTMAGKKVTKKKSYGSARKG